MENRIHFFGTILVGLIEKSVDWKILKAIIKMLHGWIMSSPASVWLFIDYAL